MRNPFWKSSNFWTSAIVVLIAIIGYLTSTNVTDIEALLIDLKDAIFSGDSGQIIMAIVVLINSIYRLFFKNRVTPE